MPDMLLAIGLMSGTSLDGIDVACLGTDGDARIARGAFRTYAYDEGVRDMLRRAMSDARELVDRQARPASLAACERAITARHAEAVRRFCAETGTAVAAIDIIGFHGQTVLHRPERGLTVQLGDGPGLARSLGRPVVYDLRAADMAGGGQGAPLVPVYHRALASRLGWGPVAMVNIGGVANITAIAEDGSLIAFDTGPGGALVNDWCERHTGAAMDRGGALAASGKPDATVLAALMASDYFASPPPKSLDRNAFTLSSVEGLSPADGAATLTHFTAHAIARAAGHLPERPSAWIICGGGRHNGMLMSLLRQYLAPLGGRVASAEEAGFDGDAMEAEAWAYLAVRSLRGLAISFPLTTGVREPLTGGVLCRP